MSDPDQRSEARASGGGRAPAGGTLLSAMSGDERSAGQAGPRRASLVSIWWAGFWSRRRSVSVIAS